MANGFTYVAPLPQDRKSFSEMMREQSESRQQQRNENLALRVANQRERAQFQYKQLEKIYGFDVNGWSQDTIDAFKARQDAISNSLKTGEYSNVTDLIKDVGELSALHGMGASDAKMNMDGENAWVGWESGTSEWTQEGTEFSGDESGRNNRNGFTRGGGRSSNRRIVNGRVVADYMDNTPNGVMPLRDKIQASDPDAQLETLENGDQFMVMSDGSRIQVAGDVFNNPSVNNSANWAPPSRPLGDVGVDSFAFDLHGDVINNVRGQEIPMSRKREIVQVAFESTFNNGHTSANQRRMMQSAIAHWEARNNQRWNGDNAGVDIDGLGPQDRYIQDALSMADLDERRTPGQQQFPTDMQDQDVVASNVSDTPGVTADNEAYNTESMDPLVFERQVQNEDGETVTNPGYLGDENVVFRTIPLQARNVEWTPEGSGGRRLDVSSVQVARNGDAIVTFIAPNMSNEEVGLLFATPDTGGQEGPTAVTQLPNGSYVYRIRAGEQNQKTVLKDAIEKVLPPRVSPAGELMPSVWTQAYQDLANQE